MEFITSTRGGRKLVYQGFICVKQKNHSQGVESYECEMRRNLKQCKARIRVSGDQVVDQSGEHTHAPDIGRPEALNARQSIKRRAIDTAATAQQVLTQEMENISDQAAVKLPAIRNIRQCVLRHRKDAGNPPPVPRTRGDIVIPDEYQITRSGERFLMYDTGAVDEDRILIFGTERNLQILETSQNWFCDGTFNVVPGQLYQLFTIHALANSYMLPCVYALLPNKRQDTYTALFHALLNINPQLSSRSVMIDFEMDSMDAIQGVFPNAIVQGCFHHLSQSIYRKVQNSGLQFDYQNNPDLNISIILGCLLP